MKLHEQLFEIPTTSRINEQQ